MAQRIGLVLLYLGSIALAVSAQQSPHRGVDYISSDANLVRIQVIVFDNKGAMATDLTKKDFRVFDDGEEQRIRYFSHARQPVSLVLSLDDSESMREQDSFRSGSGVFALSSSFLTRKSKNISAMNSR